MDAKDLSLVERVLAAAANAKPSIHRLYGLHWSARSKLPDLKKLFDDLCDLGIFVQTLHNNRDGFLGRNIEDQQQFLKECHCLLTSSREVCVKLHGALEDVLQDESFWRRVRYREIQRRVYAGEDVIQDSSFWRRMEYHEIQRRVDANRLYITQLRIWTITLYLLIEVMKFNTDRTDMYTAPVEAAIKQVRNGLGIIDHDIARLLPVEISQSERVCEIAAEILNKTQTPEIANNTVIENRSDFTLVGQTRVESRWTRIRKAWTRQSLTKEYSV